LIDPIEQFRAAIAGAGLEPPESIEADGKIHRFSTSGKRGDEAGWYSLHLDGIPAGSFGCWRAGLQSTWCAKSDHQMTPAERETQRQRLKAIQQQRDAEQAQRQQQAAESASTLWAKADPAPADHPYLAKKGVQPHGAKVFGDNLLIALRDTAGKLHSLQTIDPEGDKRFHPGGRVVGCYFGIGKPDGLLVIAEGFATGGTIHEATGHAAAIAFNAGGLMAVARALRAKFPTWQLIVAADDDHRTPGNPGLTKARAAAQAVGGLLAVPSFPADRPDGATDFNDLAQLAGLDAVRLCIEAAQPVAAPTADGGPTFPALVSDEVPHHEGDVQAGPPDGVVLVNGSDLVPEPVRWLWDGWLALGKLHILAGAPGQGKTTIAIAMAATVTVGGRWPDGSPSLAGNVLIWSGEDDPADTLLPRLLAAGADRSRCYFVSGTRIDGEVQSFDPARDMGALETQALAIGGIKLLMVDPVVSAVAGDSHKNTEVRRALQPLVDLASRLDAAAIGISHFSKGGQGSDPASRVVGSIAFTAVARVVLVAAKVKGEEGEERRILARGKSNIGPDDGGFEYHIEQSEPLPGIHASYIGWGVSVAGSARELLAEPTEQDEEGRSAVEAAEDFLRQVLADGLTPAKTVKAEAGSAGVSWASVRRAASTMGVVKTKTGEGWYWKLGAHFSQGAQGAQVSDVEHVEHLREHLAPNQAQKLKVLNQDAQGAHVQKVEHLEHLEHLAPEMGISEQPSDAEDAEVF